MIGRVYTILYKPWEWLSSSLVWYSFTCFLMNYRAPFYFHYKLLVYWIYRLPIVPWSESADILLKQTTTRATFHHQRCSVCPLPICPPSQNKHRTLKVTPKWKGGNHLYTNLTSNIGLLRPFILRGLFFSQKTLGRLGFPSLSEPKHLSFHHHPVASQQQVFPLWGHLTWKKVAPENTWRGTFP